MFFYRPGQILGPVSCGRGVLSMSALSYGVIRVDQENSLTSLTLQDCGQIMPGGTFYFCLLYFVKIHCFNFVCKLYFHFKF